ncbi:MAG: hypothetical protein JWR80_6017 [Bradyrhizobium sp.]|nr:hypothetical protein [Bradyrhizobium sp.]
MLAQLKDLHTALLAAIAEMETAAAQTVPDGARLGTIRWTLSRASRHRHMLIEDTIYPHLLACVAPADIDRLLALREDARALRVVSTVHVGRWNARTIIDEWDTYRSASAAMTTSMRARVVAEQRLLYALLERLGSAESMAGRRTGPA